MRLVCLPSSWSREDRDITVGSEKIYKKGFLDYKQDIIESRNRLDFLNDKEALDKRAQLNAMEIACDAIIILGERYAALARELQRKRKMK